MAAADRSLKLHTGASMPLVGLGTWQSAPGAVHDAVVAALEGGYRHIDCAAAYGNEAEVGAAIKEVIAKGVVKREELFVTSKLWVTRSHPDDALAALDDTLKALQLEYLDLYLVHWPFFMKKGSAFPPPDRSAVLGYSSVAYLAVWRELEKAVDAGKARAIGCSNSSAQKLADLVAAARIQPAVVQVEAHPFLAQRRLKAFCDAHGIIVTAYSPLGSPDRPKRLVDDADPAPLHEAAVTSIAARLGVSPARVLIRWSVQRGVVAIPKSTSPARIAENGDVWSFELSPADVAALAALDSGRRILKGAAFLSEGQSWPDLWDTDWEAAHVPLATA